MWKAYFSKSTGSKFVLGIVFEAGCGAKAILLFLLLCFVASLVFYGVFTEWALFPAMLFELALIFMVDRIKDRSLSNKFSDLRTQEKVPDNYNNKSDRYLVFRNHLKNEEEIPASAVRSCIELVDLQLEMERALVDKRRQAFGFLPGLSLGLLAALWGQLGEEQIFSYGFVVLVLFGVAALGRAMLPSKLNQLYEMKYFMKLYSQVEAE